MRMPARAKGQAEMLAVLLGGVALALGLLVGLTLAFAGDLPATAWAGLGVVAAVAGFLTASAFAIVVGSDRPTLEPAWRARPRPGDPHRVLVVANEAIGSAELRRAVCTSAAACESEVLVVAPALASPLEHWTDAEDEARAAAERRLEEELAALAELGLSARGVVGADDPLQAIDDALRTFPADEIVISTHPADRANWLEEGVVARVRETYGLPLTHVIATSEELAPAWSR